MNAAFGSTEVLFEIDPLVDFGFYIIWTLLDKPTLFTNLP
jgi:hypothetical protein